MILEVDWFAIHQHIYYYSSNFVQAGAPTKNEPFGSIFCVTWH